jgi:hypothetical protein
MHRVQETQLCNHGQQEKAAEETGKEEILQVVQGSHLAQGIEVV